MEILGWILSVLIIPLCLVLIPFLWKVFLYGPELTIELISSGGTSEPFGLSTNNDYSKGYIEGINEINYFKVTWKFKVIITNNSMLTAYYPKLIFPEGQLAFTLIDELKYLNPIKENEIISLNAKFEIIEECKGVDRTHIKGLPPHFENLRLLLEYKNQYKRIFFTLFIFDNKQGKNNFQRKKPKEF